MNHTENRTTLNTPQPHEIGFCRDKEAAHIFGISRALWWQWTKEGKAPKPIKISVGVTVWRRSEVYALVDQLAAKGDAQ